MKEQSSQTAKIPPMLNVLAKPYSKIYRYERNNQQFLPLLEKSKSAVQPHHRLHYWTVQAELQHLLTTSRQYDQLLLHHRQFNTAINTAM